MRLGTYNLLHGVAVLDADARPVPLPPGRTLPPPADAGLLSGAIASLDADVLGLQEVDVHQPRSGGAHQVRVAAAALGAADWRFAPALCGTPGGRDRRWTAVESAAADPFASDGDAGPRYGVGLVSRLPVRSWRATTFPAAPLWLPLLVPGRPRPRLVPVADEPRAAIAAVVEGRHGPLTIATVHLSFVPGWNVRQLRALVRWLADLPRPLVLLGDLNLPGGLPARITGWRSLARAATYPVVNPRVQLDHVLCDGLDATGRVLVHRLAVSDHAALTVDLPG